MDIDKDQLPDGWSYAQAAAAGIPERCWGYPRLHPPTTEDSGLSIGYLVDNDGSLVRLIQN